MKIELLEVQIISIFGLFAGSKSTKPNNHALISIQTVASHSLDYRVILSYVEEASPSYHQMVLWNHPKPGPFDHGFAILLQG